MFLLACYVFIYFGFKLSKESLYSLRYPSCSSSWCGIYIGLVEL